DHLAYFGTFGTIRSRPLLPPDNPLPVLERLERSEQAFWLKGYLTKFGSIDRDEPYRSTVPRSLIREQLLKTIDPVYHVEGEGGYRLGFPEDVEQKRWEEVEAEVARRKPKWDVQRQTYVSTVGPNPEQTKRSTEPNHKP